MSKAKQEDEIQGDSTNTPTITENISELVADLGRTDLNEMVAKLNEVIRKING